MAVDIKMGTDIVWGTSSAGTLTLGKILSCESKTTAKMHEQVDENDELYSAVFHDQREEVTLEVLTKPATSKPEPGDVLTVAGITDLLVKEASEKWATGSGVKYAITAFKSLA